MWPGGGHRGHPHPVADLDDLAVADRGPFEGHVVVGVDEVRRACALGQRETAGDVVVVDVGLEHVGEPDPLRVEEVEDAVDVPLGVDDEGDLAVMDEVGAVTQGGRLESQHGDAAGGHEGAGVGVAHGVSR